MPVSVTLPALGESVTEGTVTRWLKQVGEQVQTDEPLLEVSTDKVDTEIPAPHSGVLLEIKVGEDETIEVGAELAVIGSEEEQGTSQAASGGAHAAAGEEQPASQEPASQEPASQEPAGQPQPAATEAAPQQAPPPPAEPEPQQQPAAAPSGDSTPVTLPALGESVTEGTVTRWLKQVGEQVQTDEPLLEVSTDKVDTEIPAPTSGVLSEIKAGEDETVEVGAELAVIAAADGQVSGGTTTPSEPAAAPQAEPEPAPAQPEPQPQAQPQAQPYAPAAPAEPAPAATAGTVQPDQPTQGAEPAAGESPTQYVTPLVRKLASEHDIDLATLRGTGVGGRIRKQDVLEAADAKKRAAAQPPAAEAPSAPTAAPGTVEPSPLRGTTEKLPRMRRIIAERMVESLHTAAQLTTVLEADVTPIARLRDKVKADFAQREGVKLSFMPFFAKACVEALKQHPKLNASLDLEQGQVTYHGAENLVVAVDTERGLLVPVIKDAGDLNIAGLARKISDLAERARNSTVTPDDLAGGTFTLTNTGSRGVLFDTPIFPQPQVGMLGTGSVVKRPVVIDDPNLGETIAVRHMVYLSLSYDHRLVDGADAARFLNTIKQRLEEGRFESEFGL